MSHVLASTRRQPVVAAAAVLVVLVLATSPLRRAGADHQPADKVTATGSTVEIMRTQPGPGGQGEETVVKVLETTLKTSSPADLLIQATAECALWTTTATEGNENSGAFAQVQMYVTIDAPPGSTPTTGIPVSTDDTGDDAGKVVFCDREQRMITENFSDDEIIRLFQRTRSANGFNWAAFNLGNGVHTVALWARLVAEVDDGNPENPPFQEMAAAAVGKRTLIIEPTKFPSDVDEVPQSGPTATPS